MMDVNVKELIKKMKMLVEKGKSEAEGIKEKIERHLHYSSLTMLNVRKLMKRMEALIKAKKLKERGIIGVPISKEREERTEVVQAVEEKGEEAMMEEISKKEVPEKEEIAMETSRPQAAEEIPTKAEESIEEKKEEEKREIRKEFAMEKKKIEEAKEIPIVPPVLEVDKRKIEKILSQVKEEIDEDKIKLEIVKLSKEYITAKGEEKEKIKKRLDELKALLKGVKAKKKKEEMLPHFQAANTLIEMQKEELKNIKEKIYSEILEGIKAGKKKDEIISKAERRLNTYLSFLRQEYAREIDELVFSFKEHENEIKEYIAKRGVNIEKEMDEIKTILEEMKKMKTLPKVKSIEDLKKITKKKEKKTAKTKPGKKKKKRK